jgi:NADP-dependent 3-hydroxy acid dehydrogenase YdfG
MMHDNTAAPSIWSDRFGPAQKCLVMTGGTSGIGRRALQTLLGERPNWSVILFARASPRLDELLALPGAFNRLAVVPDVQHVL